MDYLSELYFSTSSQIKFDQYKEIFHSYNYLLVLPSKIPSVVVEPQLENVEDAHELIVSHPLKSIARFVLKHNCTPFMMEDTMLVINAFSKKQNKTLGLPGPDTKNWWKNLGNEGVLHFLENEIDRSAFFLCTIGVLVNKSNYIYASHKVDGHISEKICFTDEAHNQFPRTNPFFFHQVFIPENSEKTYAEMAFEDFKYFDYRRQCVKKIVEKLDQYKLNKPIQLELF